MEHEAELAEERRIKAEAEAKKLEEKKMREEAEEAARLAEEERIRREEEAEVEWKSSSDCIESTIYHSKLNKH